jgi:hypothetical protein
MWEGLLYNGELPHIVAEVWYLKDGVAPADIQATIARSKQLQKDGKRRMPVTGALKDIADELQKAAAPHVNGAWFAHPSGDSSLQFNLASRSAASEADEKKQKDYRSNTKARFYCAEGVEPLLLLWTWPETGEEAFHDKHRTKAYVWMRFRFVQNEQGEWVYGGVEVLRCTPKEAGAAAPKAKRVKRARVEAAAVEEGEGAGGAPKTKTKMKRARKGSREQRAVDVLNTIKAAGGSMAIRQLEAIYPDFVGKSKNWWISDVLQKQLQYVCTDGNGTWSITAKGEEFLSSHK